jgi:MFS transporter, PPP family, 3-phenylpropionic acid transporter
MGAGVAIEVGVMAMAPRLVGRFGGRAMVRTAAFVAAVRFALTACFDDPYAVAAIQALHGVSFGAFWVGSMALVAERAPPNQRASATALLMATTAGIGPLLAMPLAALLLPVRGGQALFAVAAVASTIAFLASTKITHDATQLPRHEIA